MRNTKLLEHGRFASAAGGAGGQHDDGRVRAIAEGTAALESSPGDSVMLYNGACLYSRIGDASRAVDTLRQAIAPAVPVIRTGR